jgi:hypothetical protein
MPFVASTGSFGARSEESLLAAAIDVHPLRSKVRDPPITKQHKPTNRGACRTAQDVANQPRTSQG